MVFLIRLRFGRLQNGNTEFRWDERDKKIIAGLISATNDYIIFVVFRSGKLNKTDIYSTRACFVVGQTDRQTDSDCAEPNYWHSLLVVLPSVLVALIRKVCSLFNFYCGFI